MKITKSKLKQLIKEELSLMEFKEEPFYEDVVSENEGALEGGYTQEHGGLQKMLQALLDHFGIEVPIDAETAAPPGEL